MAVLFAAVAAGPVAGQAGDDRAFERELFKTRFEQEVKFRAATVHVAWAAEALCHATGEIEPFVLLSVHALRRQLADGDLALFRQVTGMDDKWRVVWLDEGAPEALQVGDAVVAVNGRPLPGGDTRIEPGPGSRAARCCPATTRASGTWCSRHAVKPVQGRACASPWKTAAR